MFDNKRHFIAVTKLYIFAETHQNTQQIEQQYSRHSTKSGSPRARSKLNSRGTPHCSSCMDCGQAHGC